MTIHGYSFAVVLARGGSRRLPGKNKKLLGGKPLFVWSVMAALEADVFDEVWVSSDDSEILEIARGMAGVIPDERPAELCGDNVSGSEVMTCLIDKALARRNASDNRFCMLHPTSPFRDGNRIGEAMAMLENDGVDFVVGVKEYGIPPHFALSIDKQGVVPVHEGYLTKMTHTRQAPVLYHPAGGLYAGRCETFLTMRSFYGKRTRGLVLDSLTGWDINTPDEFAVAEAILARIKIDSV